VQILCVAGIVGEPVYAAPSRLVEIAPIVGVPVLDLRDTCRAYDYASSRRWAGGEVCSAPACMFEASSTDPRSGPMQRINLPGNQAAATSGIRDELFMNSGVHRVLLV
jgi:hypothetical protein